MMHDTLSLEILQQFDEKECKMLLHIAPRTDTFVDDTSKTMKDENVLG